MKWNALFDYVNKKCNFHEKVKGKIETSTWTCYHDLRFVKEFCKKHKLAFQTVKKRLEHTGGYCDCEVLFNSTMKINRNEEIE